MTDTPRLPSFSPSPELVRAIRARAQRELFRRRLRRRLGAALAGSAGLAATLTLALLPLRAAPATDPDTLMELLAYDCDASCDSLEEGYYRIVLPDYPADYYAAN